MSELTIWQRLAAPLMKEEVSWRIDGKPSEKNGKWSARVVAYCDVPAVIRRLDAVVPGRWQFNASLPIETADKDGVVSKSVRGTLTIDGVIREDYGVGPDEKQALTDALKRSARLFGIAIELWEMDPIWSDVSDGTKYAKITGDPWGKYKRSEGGRTGGPATAGAAGTHNPPATAQPSALPGPDYVMPIGKKRGTKVGELDTATLQEAAAWVHEKNFAKKYPDLLIAISATLKAREAA